MAAHEWDNWMQVSASCRRQVAHAVSLTDADTSRAGECGLAVAVMAFMLEAYSNLHLRNVIPEAVHEAFEKLSVPLRYKMFPRLLGVSNSYLVHWENDTIHQTIAGVFTRRNQFAHGKVRQLALGDLTAATTNRLWNACLDMLVKLETGPAGRLPESRHEDYIREVDGMRIGGSDAG